MRPSLVIAAVLGVQFAGPLHYYLFREDPGDERFAWRMFSARRLQRCEVSFRSAGEPIALARFFHPAWIELARRGRRPVVRAMAARLCGAERFGPSGVSVTLECEGIDRRRERVLADGNVCEGDGT